MSRLFDGLLVFWVLCVGVVYFGGYFLPQIGAYTPSLAAVYAIMLILSALAFWRRHARPQR